MRGLGQDGGDGVNWGSIAQLIQSGAAGAAGIIDATRAAPYNIYPNSPIYAPIGAGGGPMIRQQAMPPVSAGFLGLPPWVWLVGLGIGAVVALRR